MQHLRCDLGLGPLLSGRQEFEHGIGLVTEADVDGYFAARHQRTAGKKWQTNRACQPDSDPTGEGAGDRMFMRLCLRSVDQPSIPRSSAPRSGTGARLEWPSTAIQQQGLPAVPRQAPWRFRKP